MIKSTKSERDAVIARLKDALKSMNNSELKTTLDALEDLNALEERIVSLCEDYEKSMVDDYKKNYAGSQPTFHTYEIQNKFYLNFHSLEEFVRNHHRVQRAMRSTDSEIARISQGNQAVVRGRGFATAQNQQRGNPVQWNSILGTPKKQNGSTVATPPNSAPNNQAGGTQKATSSCSKCGTTNTKIQKGLCLSCQLSNVLNGMHSTQQQAPVAQKVVQKCNKCKTAPCEKGSSFCFNCNNTACFICPTIIGGMHPSKYCSHCAKYVKNCSNCNKEFVPKTANIYTAYGAKKNNATFSDSDTVCQWCHINCVTPKPSLASKILGFVNKSLDDVL